MSKAIELFPYEVSNAIALKLYDFDDPTSETQPSIKSSSASPESDLPTVYDAYSEARTWKKLNFKLKAALSEDELRRVLPATTDLTRDVSLTVLLTCPSTKLRHGIRLTPDSTGSWAGVASLQRDDVRGAVSLRPQIVRLTSIPTDEEVSFATRAGMMVAFGTAVSLYIDSEPQRRSLDAQVVTTWEDFANSTHLWRREHSDDIYHVEAFAEPRVYLNSRYAQLREMMESTAKRGPEAAFRDLSAVLIAQPVLLQLATAALASIEADEEGAELSIPGGWKGDLIATLLPRLYPEEVDPDEAARRAAREIRDGEGSATLQSRLGSVVQDMASTYRTVETATRSLESIRQQEEVVSV